MWAKDYGFGRSPDRGNHPACTNAAKWSAESWGMSWWRTKPWYGLAAPKWETQNQKMNTSVFTITYLSQAQRQRLDERKTSALLVLIQIFFLLWPPIIENAWAHAAFLASSFNANSDLFRQAWIRFSISLRPQVQATPYSRTRGFIKAVVVTASKYRRLQWD